VQAGLLGRHPFTADIAKENVPEHMWRTPAFRRVNYLLTGIWAGIFLIMSLSYLVRLCMPLLHAWEIIFHHRHGDPRLTTHALASQIVALTNANGQHRSGLFIAFNYAVPLGFLFAGLVFSKW
jgi:hypothetical protein